jgi:hypothetical protein
VEGLGSLAGAANMSDPKQQIIDRMEQLGPAQVRLLVQSGGLPSGWEIHAVEWLAKKDQEERRTTTSVIAEQTEIARSAVAAAERQAIAAESANTRATWALVISIISIVITVVGLLLVHFDTVRH